MHDNLKTVREALEKAETYNRNHMPKHCTQAIEEAFTALDALERGVGDDSYFEDIQELNGDRGAINAYVARVAYEAYREGRAASPKPSSNSPEIPDSSQTPAAASVEGEVLGKIRELLFKAKECVYGHRFGAYLPITEAIDLLSTIEQAPAQKGMTEDEKLARARALHDAHTTAKAKGDEPIECKHDPFEGRCIHCDVKFVGGVPVRIVRERKEDGQV